MVIKEIKEDRERIKDYIEEKLKYCKSKRVLKIGEERLNHLIKCIFFRIDNPDYTPKEEKW